MTHTPAISKTYISSLIPQHASILDIGSFDGKDAQELATVCQSNVHCFEPTESSYLKLMALEDERLTLWKYAVSSFNGRTTMNVSPDHPQSNSIKTPRKHLKAFPGVRYNGTEPVNVTTLDSWNWSVRKGAPIDFIWCDVNGAEADFIVGAVNTLAVTHYLYIEFAVVELFARSLNLYQLEQALPGFENIGTYSVGDNYGNVLFKNKNTELFNQ